MRKKSLRKNNNIDNKGESKILARIMNCIKLLINENFNNLIIIKKMHLNLKRKFII